MNIKVLAPEEARKIAAGEVIDRPSALVREFMDNAIDAGAGLIEVLIEEGGISLVEVSDDGEGMSREDLSLSWLNHATSKIRSLDDLAKMSTLGFRGEALSAAAAVSALEILTSRDGKEAWKLRVGPGERNKPLMEQSRRKRGSNIRAMGLYDSIPARKRFLRRAGSEGMSCRQIFNEKAMAFPDISFRFIQDGKLICYYPGVSSLRERFCQIHLKEGEGAFLHEIAASGKNFSVSIVAGGPELYRRDRRLQYIYANKRRIQDFALVQALEYGLQGWFPGGNHPLGALFVNVDPAHADFNIHPAKREVRFADPGAIHHAVTTALRDFCRKAVMASSHRETQRAQDVEQILDLYPPSSPMSPAPPVKNSFKVELLANEAAEAAEPYQAGKVRYLGRLFDLFILIEKDEQLFIIDQHAAHERILFEDFINSPIPKQELLVPLPFSTQSQSEDNFLEEKQAELYRLGITLNRGTAPHEWQIEALPAGWKLSDSETVKEILSLNESKESVAESWMISLSCWGAVKEGDTLDEESALALAEKAFALPHRHCPHGRPIWFEICRNELLKAVKRI